MAESPMLDLLAHEAAAIRWLTDAALAEFLTDVERIGWDEARHTLKRHRRLTGPVPVPDPDTEWR